MSKDVDNESFYDLTSSEFHNKLRGSCQLALKGRIGVVEPQRIQTHKAYLAVL
jgi:hypothetical protein